MPKRSAALVGYTEWAPERNWTRPMFGMEASAELAAAALADGQTLLENAAREPEVEDLAHFLNAGLGDLPGPHGVGGITRFLVPQGGTEPSDQIPAAQVGQRRQQGLFGKANTIGQLTIRMITDGDVALDSRNDFLFQFV